ncbi:MAG: AsmA-like C-terminal region-containing protein [Cytophagaceae bacterium]
MVFTRKSRKWTFISIGIGIGLLTIIYITLQLFTETIKNNIESKLNNTLTADIKFSQFEFSIFKHFPKPTLVFYNNSIIGQDEFQHDTLITCPRIDVEFNWETLWASKTSIHSIHLYEPNILIHILQNGHHNFDIFESDTTSNESGSPLSIEELIVEAGIIRYWDYQNDIEIIASGIEHNGKINVIDQTFQYNTHSHLSGFTLSHKNITYIRNKEVDFNVDHLFDFNKQIFEFIGHELKINDVSLSFNGLIQNQPKGVYTKMVYKTKKTDFESLVSLLPGMYKNQYNSFDASGKMSINGMVDGVIGNFDDTIPKFSVDIEIEKGFFQVQSLPFKADSINCDLEISNLNGHKDSTVYNLKYFHTTVDQHQIDGHALIKGGKNKFVDIQLKGDFNLGNYGKLMPLSYSDLKGDLFVDIQAKGILDYQFINDSTFQLVSVPTFSINSSLTDGELAYDSLPEKIHNVHLVLKAQNTTGKPDNTIIHIPTFMLEFANNKIYGNTYYKGYLSPYIDAEINGDVNLEDIQKVVPMKDQELKGLIDFNVKAKGDYNKRKNKFPILESSFLLTEGFYNTTVSTGELKHLTFKGTAVNKSGNWKNTYLEIENFSGTFEEEPFEIKGKIFDLDKLKYQLSINGKVNLERYTTLHPIEGYKLRGDIACNILTEGSLEEVQNKELSNTHTTGKISIKNFVCLGSNYAKWIKIYDAQLQFNDDQLKIEKCEFKWGKSNGNIKGYIDDYLLLFLDEPIIKGQITMQGDSLNYNNFIKHFQPLSANNSTTVVTNNNNNNTASGVTNWRVPKEWDFNLVLQYKTVIYEDLTFQPLYTNVNVENRTFTVNQFIANCNGASYNLKGNYNTINKTPTFNTQIAISNFDIQKNYSSSALVRSWAPSASEAFGVVKLDYAISGKLNKDYTPQFETLIGEGDITISNAKINGMKLFDEISKKSSDDNLKDPHVKDFAMHSYIKNNKFYVPNFNCKINGLDTEVEGETDFSGPIRFLIKIQLLPVDLIKVPFHVTGTYDDPKVVPGKGKDK